MSEEMRCSICKKDVVPEVSDDGSMSYCPICHTGYRNISYAALMREQADEAAVLSEFENETSPKAVRQLTPDAADKATPYYEPRECGNCGVFRSVDSEGYVEKCPNCKDDEYTIFPDFEGIP